jgi:hypothetical protein
MIRNAIILLSLVFSLTACDPVPNPNPSKLHAPYLRVEDYYRGHQFVGALFTPGGDVEISVLNAPVPCGQSFCASGAWQSLGTVKAGHVGGQWPSTEGQFRVVFNKEELERRRGVRVTCYPGHWWDTFYLARDVTTNHKAAHNGPSSSAYWAGAARCP